VNRIKHRQLRVNREGGESVIEREPCRGEGFPVEKGKIIKQFVSMSCGTAKEEGRGENREHSVEMKGGN